MKLFSDYHQGSTLPAHLKSNGFDTESLHSQVRLKSGQQLTNLGGRCIVGQQQAPDAFFEGASEHAAPQHWRDHFHDCPQPDPGLLLLIHQSGECWMVLTGLQ